ncbi:UNVERIFIED_CONTAM: Agamous-like MADS-box protein MADS1 [Sesamum latifolium]|uniref:Agamous-like MADS-box protein MADS1 n=1 Tax=Sesamum latifolium TaxID=2727402 RepID=A0AAW2WQI6_9LAMI
MTLKDLKSMEGKLEKAISRIRSKKNELLFAEIELMQKRELELHNANMFLRAKIAENERAQQQMNLMPAGSSDDHHHQYQPMTSSHEAAYDLRNFLPMNLMEPNHHYLATTKRLSSLSDKGKSGTTSTLLFGQEILRIMMIIGCLSVDVS